MLTFSDWTGFTAWRRQASFVAIVWAAVLVVHRRSHACFMHWSDTDAEVFFSYSRCLCHAYETVLSTFVLEHWHRRSFIICPSAICSQPRLTHTLVFGMSIKALLLGSQHCQFSFHMFGKDKFWYVLCDKKRCLSSMTVEALWLSCWLSITCWTWNSYVCCTCDGRIPQFTLFPSPPIS